MQVNKTVDFTFDISQVVVSGIPEPIPESREERVGHIQNLTEGHLYSYVLPKSLTSQEGEYTVGVLLTGK